MKIISNKETSANIIELEIEVSAEELETAIQACYEKEGGNIAVPGFRKGKAPRKLIEQRFGKGVFVEDAVNNLYPKAYSEAVKEAELDPVAPGDVEILEVDPEKGFTFKAIVTVKPKVDVKNYKGISAEKEVKAVEEADIDAEIDRMLERNSRLVEVEDRAAKDGDTTVIDFDGFVEEVAFEGGKGEDHTLVLGSASFIPGFEEQIVGKSVGDNFDVTVVFPEEYHAENLAGKPAVFKVNLKQIKFTELPELDDEFAKDVSEFDTLDELKKDIRKNQEERSDKAANDDLENKLVDVVIENLEGEIPEVMYDVKVDEMVDDFSHRLSHQGMNLELYLQYTGMDLEDFKKTFREQAERQVKIRLALDKIVELEKIEPTQEEINVEYGNLAENYKMEVEELKKMIPEEHVKADLSSAKAIDLIKDSAKVKETKAVAKKEVVKKEVVKKEVVKKEAVKKEAAPKKAVKKTKKEETIAEKTEEEK